MAVDHESSSQKLAYSLRIRAKLTRQGFRCFRTLIRVFRHCQQLDCQPDFHLVDKIRECRDLVDDSVINSKEANVSFKAILSEPGAVYPTLNMMHELGVLGRFIPEFDKLTCLVQHEFYHRYTADVHTLSTIRELDRVFTEAEPITLKYRKALHETSDPVMLYLILILHDIGKAVGIRGHAESGVRIAEPILQRLDISSNNREIIAYIIKNHLAMSRFWQKRDVDDPETAGVGDRRRELATSDPPHRRLDDRVVDAEESSDPVVERLAGIG